MGELADACHFGFRLFVTRIERISYSVFPSKAVLVRRQPYLSVCGTKQVAHLRANGCRLPL